MKSTAVLSIGIICLLLTVSGAGAEEPWSLFKQSNGIDFFSRRTEGYQYEQVKAVSRMDTPTEILELLFRDFSGYPDWFGFCREMEILQRSGDDLITVFFAMDTPWPVQDRYVIMDVRFVPPDGTGRIVIEYSKSANEHPSRKAGYLPMAALEGMCIIKPVSFNLSEVSFIMATDPGIQAPQVFIRNYIEEQMTRTVDGMMRMSRN